MDETKPAAVDVTPVVEANNDEVICPKCSTQFRAIPVNVQAELSKAEVALGDATDKDASITELLDKSNIPSFLPAPDGSSVALNTVGRLAVALSDRKRLIDVASEASIVIPETPDIIQARALLAESFKWLMVTDDSAELRQRIKFFLNQK